MVDGKYEHQGVDLRPLYKLMSQTMKVKSGGGDFARALVEAGWRPPVEQQAAREQFVERRRMLPGLCVAGKANGILTAHGTLCCFPELENGSGLCEEHSR